MPHPAGGGSPDEPPREVNRSPRYPTPPPFNRGGGPDRLAGSAGALPSLVDAPLRVPARPWLPASLGMNRALQTMAGESTSKTESRTSP